MTKICVAFSRGWNKNEGHIVSTIPLVLCMYRYLLRRGVSAMFSLSDIFFKFP